MLSQDGKKNLAEGDIFWGNQQAWKGERGQQKKVENVRGLKGCRGKPLCMLLARLGSRCCHRLPGYSPLSRCHEASLLQLSSTFVHFVLWHKARSWGPFPFWVGGEDSLAGGCQHASRTSLGSLPGWAFAILWGALQAPRDKAVL